MAMTEQEAKKAFAVALLERPGKPFEAAFAIFPDLPVGHPEKGLQTSRALHAASLWENDPDVLEYQRNATAHPQAAGLIPDKEQVAREVLERSRKCRDDETALKGFRLFADMMGYIEKAGAAPSQTVNMPNAKVIVMPAQLSKEAWSLQATTQQRQLVIEGERIANAG